MRAGSPFPTDFAFYVAVVTCLLPAAEGAEDIAEEWCRFRGPNGSGVAPANSLPPVALSPKLEAWRTPVPEGLSSPVIGGNQIFLTGIEHEQLVTLAFAQDTGELLWHRTAPGRASEKVHPASSPAASTPLVHRNRLFVYFGSFGLLCYDLDGTERWRKPIPTPESLYGMSTSPIGCGDHVFLVLDSDRNLPKSELSESALLAVNASNGETAWTTPRPFSRSGWSTPVLLENETGTDLIVLGQGRLQAYDTATGEGRWFLKGFSRETIAVPAIGDGGVWLVFPTWWRAISRKTRHHSENLKPFDTNSNQKIERSEMVGDFTFPFRPELPPGHPGFGMPLPDNPEKRKERINWLVTWIDKNKDGVWTKEEFFSNLSSGRGLPLLAAVHPGGSGDISQTHVKWVLNRGIPEIPSPLYHDGTIYRFAKVAFSRPACRQWRDLYRERIPDAPGQYSASPILANGHLYLTSSLGKVTVIKAGDSLQLVHQFELPGHVETTPAIDDTAIYLDQ